MSPHGLGKLQPAARGNEAASCTHSCFHSWIFHLGCGRQDPTQTRRPLSGLLFTKAWASPLCPTHTWRVPLLKSMSKAWSVFTHCRRSRAGCPRSSMLGRSPPFERRVCISHWSHTSTQNTKAEYPLSRVPTPRGQPCVCVHLATAASRESKQPKWGGYSTHLHEMLLHVGRKVAQDTHLSLQLLGDGRHREHQVLAVGRVVMYSPGGSRA